MKSESKSKLVFVIHFSMFLILIVLGIWIKRAAGHPEWVIFFHMPAALFLVLAGMQIRGWNQAGYEAEVRSIREKGS
jgi:hypothetical protein